MSNGDVRWMMKRGADYYVEVAGKHYRCDESITSRLTPDAVSLLASLEPLNSSGQIVLRDGLLHPVNKSTP